MKCGKCSHGKLLHTVWGFCLTCNVDCGSNWVAEPATGAALPTKEQAKALIQKTIEHLEVQPAGPKARTISNGVVVDVCGAKDSKKRNMTAAIQRHRCLGCGSEYDKQAAARGCFRKDRKAGAW